MLKLERRARGHFMTLIEIRVHLIRVKPGHISVHLPRILLPVHHNLVTCSFTAGKIELQVQLLYIRYDS